MNGPGRDAAAVGPPRGLSLQGRFPALDLRTAVFRGLVVLTFLFGVVAVDGFATVNNFKALLTSVAFVGIAAVGMSFVTIGGGLFMLSIGSTIAAGTVLFASLTGSLPLGLALLVTIAAAALAGAVQGVVVGRFRGDPIVTTIAAASLVIGLGQLIAAGHTVKLEGNFRFLSSDLFGAIPVEAACFIAFAVVAHLVLSRSAFGQRVRLTGENREAARLAGVPVGLVAVLTFTIAGLGAGVAAVLLSAQAGQGTLQAGIGTDFDAIAAILVGGVAVTGGRGSVLDVALGALFIAMVVNVLAVSGASFDTQLLAKGGIVLLAVCAAGLGSRLRGGER